LSKGICSPAHAYVRARCFCPAAALGQPRISYSCTVVTLGGNHMCEPTVAVVQPVPAAQRGKVLTSGNALIENGLVLGQALLFLPVALTPAIAGGLMSTGQVLFDRNQTTILPALTGLALSAGLMWLLAGQLLRKPWSARYVFNATRAELQERVDAIFDVNAPDAILAEII